MGDKIVWRNERRKLRELIPWPRNPRQINKQQAQRLAQSLQCQHPDVVTITRKWNRWQHQVDYRPFKGNKLKLKPGVTIPEGVNNYGMILVKREE